MSYDMGLEEFRRLDSVQRACLLTRRSLTELFDELREAYRQAYKGINDDPEPFRMYVQRRITEIATYPNDVEDNEEGHAIRKRAQQDYIPIGD